MTRTNNIGFIPIVMTGAMLLVLISLGNWQMDRLTWKNELIATIAQRDQAEPLSIKSGADLKVLSRPDHDFHPITIEGTWRVDLEQYWFATANNIPDGLAHRDRVGFHVLTPLALSDGAILYIDRGFVPERLRDIEARPQNLPRKIMGILRWPDERTVFDAEDLPNERTWYVRNTIAMAQASGISSYPFLVEQTAPQMGWPYAGQSRRVLTNRHLEYALTWYGFGLILVIISALWHIRAYRRVNA